DHHRCPDTHQLTLNPAISATIHIEIATSAAKLQPLTFAILNRDGRLIAGPANKSISAAPGGKPAASRPRESGTSRKVGSARGTATVAVIRTAMNFADGCVRACGGNHST